LICFFTHNAFAQEQYYSNTLAGGTFLDGVSSAVKMNKPAGLAQDKWGNIYFSDKFNHRIRKITPQGLVSLYAGSGTRALLDGTVLTAGFNAPEGLACDTFGNLFVADLDNYAIRKITPTGVVTTIAGTGVQGYRNGPGNQAQFYSPYGVVCDDTGNVYVTDAGNGVIRKVARDGTVSNFYGTYNFGNPTSSPNAITRDAAGNFYYTDSRLNSLFKLTLRGVRTTITSGLNVPQTVTLDSRGNFFVSQNSTLLSISPRGIITTLAGSTTTGFVDGAGAIAQFYNPLGILCDNIGNIYVADTQNDRIRKVTTLGVVSTLAGGNITTSANGVGREAGFKGPNGIAKDRLGNIYVADADNYLIRKIDRNGIVSTYAGTGIQGQVDGPSNQASFKGLKGLLCDTIGNLFVADFHKIRKITPQGMVSTYSGSSTSGFRNDILSNALYNNPTEMTFDSEGNLIIVDSDNHRLRFIDRNGNVGTYAGTGEAGLLNGRVDSCNFSTPYGLTFDSFGNLYVSDQDYNVIRKIAPNGIVSTFAGNGNCSSLDGRGRTAGFCVPCGMTSDDRGNIYVADLNNNKIRKITNTTYVSTIAGNGQFDYSEGYGMLSRYNWPAALVMDSSDVILVADYLNNAIRKIKISNITTPVQEKIVQKFSLYPNPAASFFTISVPSPTTITILNHLGQVIHTEYIQDITTLQTDSFSNGLYLIQAQGYATARLVLVK